MKSHIGTWVRLAAVMALALALGGTRAGGSAPSPAAATMAYIPGSVFEMGDSLAEGYFDELPVHAVWVSGFAMDVFEVSKARWDEVATWAAGHGYDIDTTSAEGKAANHPAINVSWYEAVKWANARSEMEGLTPCYVAGTSVCRTGEQSDVVCRWSAGGYRLPTEAEWEKAARGGVAGSRFPWSDTDTIQHVRANYYSRGDMIYDMSPTRGYHPDHCVQPQPYTSPVGSFAPNGYGLYDMAGNVWEWCWDWYDEAEYASSPDRDPLGASLGTYRVLRGGAWDNLADHCRVTHRYVFWPDRGIYHLGFRLVRTMR